VTGEPAGTRQDRVPADGPPAALPRAGGAVPGAGGPGQPPAVTIAVCYDGCWYQHVSRFFDLRHGAAISVAGLHDAIRWHAAAMFSCPVQAVAITQAHYIAGRTGPSPWDDTLDEHGITRHDVPVTATKGEVGADVELALTCYQIACDTSPAMIALLAGDGDFAPLAARLACRGVRVLVPRANFTYPRDGTTAAITTSAWLTQRATDPPALTDLLNATQREDYPPFLTRAFPETAGPRAAALTPCAADGRRVST
jgi:hypothetical protein